MKLFAVLGVFLTPVVAAYALYFTGWRSGATVNHGELVVPARPIADVTLRTMSGDPLEFSRLRGKWTFVYFGSAECPPPCERNLYKMRQVQLAQGSESRRIQRLFAVTDATALDLLRYKLRDYPGMLVAIGPREAVREWRRRFSPPGPEKQSARDRVYLVDPLGNLLLSYPADADPSGMRKDVARLLRVSQIG